MNCQCPAVSTQAFLRKVCSLFALLSLSSLPSRADLVALPESDWQPLTAQVQRLTEALEYLRSPLDAKTQAALKEAMEEKNFKTAAEKIQNALDPHCLFLVNINPEMRVKVAAGPAKPELVEQGWRQFLVKVANESGTT